MLSTARKRIFCVLIGVALTSFASLPVSAAEDGLFEQGKAQAALDRVFEHAGQPAKVLSLGLEPDRLVVELQDPKILKHIDAWTYGSGRGGWSRLFGGDPITGPRPVQPALPNPDLEANLFELKPMDLTLVPKMVSAAVARAALDDAGAVTRMTLKRRLFLIPDVRSGDPEWEIEVSSGRERATIYADLGGHITRADVSGTQRARMVNYLAAGSELDALITRIGDAISSEPVIKRAIIYDRSMTIEAATPGHPNQLSLYNADINTVVRQTDLPAAASRQGSAGRFALTEVDWQLVPKLQQLARERLGLSAGRISMVQLSKPDHVAGEPTIQWEVDVKSATDDAVEGYVVFDAKGNVLRTKFPPGRGPKVDLLGAPALREVLSAFGRPLGEHAATVELVFREDSASVIVKDPENTDQLAEFDFPGDGVERRPVPPIRWSTFGPSWYFDLAAVAALANRWTSLQRETVSRLGLSNGNVTRITISKQKMALPRNEQMLVEIRAQQANQREGRIVYDFAGHVVRIFKP